VNQLRRKAGAPFQSDGGRTSLDFGCKSVDQKKKSVNQGIPEQKPAVEGSATAATATATAVVGAGIALAAVLEDRPAEGEEKEQV